MQYIQYTSLIKPGSCLLQNQAGVSHCWTSVKLAGDAGSIAIFHMARFISDGNLSGIVQHRSAMDVEPLYSSVDLTREGQLLSELR